MGQQGSELGTGLLLLKAGQEFLPELTLTARIFTEECIKDEFTIIVVRSSPVRDKKRD